MSAQEGCGGVAGILCGDVLKLGVRFLQWCLRMAVKSLARARASREALSCMNVSWSSTALQMLRNCYLTKLH